mgnify:FL=1
MNRRSNVKRQTKYAGVNMKNIIIYALGVYMLFVMAKRTIENYQLRNDGICTKAIIQKKYTERHKKLEFTNFVLKIKYIAVVLFMIGI